MRCGILLNLSVYMALERTYGNKFSCPAHFWRMKCCQWMVLWGSCSSASGSPVAAALTCILSHWYPLCIVAAHSTTLNLHANPRALLAHHWYTDPRHSYHWTPPELTITSTFAGCCWPKHDHLSISSLGNCHSVAPITPNLLLLHYLCLFSFSRYFAQLDTAASTNSATNSTCAHCTNSWELCITSSINSREPTCCLEEVSTTTSQVSNQ